MGWGFRLLCRHFAVLGECIVTRTRSVGLVLFRHRMFITISNTRENAKKGIIMCQKVRELTFHGHLVVSLMMNGIAILSCFRINALLL